MAQHPTTRADLEQLVTFTRALMSKQDKTPEDVERLRRSVSMLKAFEAEAGMDVSGGLAEQGAMGPAPAAVQPKQVQIPNQGFPQQISPKEQLATEAAGFQARYRTEDIIDFGKRLFLDDTEQSTLATRRRVERAMDRLDFEAKAKASGVDVEELRPAEIFGGAAPDVALSVAVPASIPARSLGGAALRVGAEAGVGAVLGGSTVPLDEDPTSRALIEGGIGLGFGAVAELPMIGTDFLRRELRAARSSNRESKLLEISEDAGIDLTLGERTGSEAVAVAERGVQGRPEGPRAKFLLKRQEQLTTSFDNIIDTLNPTQMSSGQIIRETKQAFDDTITSMNKLASTSFRESIKKPALKVGTRIDDEGRLIGGDNFIQAPELVAELRQQAQLLENQPLSTASEAVIRTLRDEADKLEKVPMNLGQLQRMLADLSAQNKPTGIVIKDNTQAADILNSKAVQRAISRDIDGVIAGNPGNEFGEALTALQDARKKFGRDRADIDVFKNKSVDRLLGKVGDPESPDFAKKILALDTRSFNELLEIAGEASPELSGALRATVFQELLDKHRKFDPGTSTVARAGTRIEVGPLVDELGRMPLSKFKSFIGTDLSIADTRQLRNALLSMQAIAEGPTKGLAVKGMREKIEQFAINAASRDIGFISRLFAGEFSPGMMERLLFTPEGQRALSTLGGPAVKRAAFANALNVVFNAIERDDEFKATVEEQKSALRQQRQLERVGNIPL